MTDLKPCPLCGFQPDIEDGDFLYPATRNGKVWSANCYEAGGGCSMNVLGSTREEALAKWNTRPAGTIGD